MTVPDTTRSAAPISRFPRPSGAIPFRTRVGTGVAWVALPHIRPRVISGEPVMRPFRLAAPLLLVALSLDSPPAGAQEPAKPVEEAFNTADGVRLKGLFHRSPGGDKQGDAVVVLLYPPGPDRDMLTGSWDGLVGRLNAAG